MESKTPVLLPKIVRMLNELGENIKLARLRRRLSMEQISERAGIGRTTLWAIEKGSPQVALGYYTQVLFVLGLEHDLLKLANDDILGRKLQDAKLLVKKRAPKKRQDETVIEITDHLLPPPDKPGATASFGGR